MSGLPFTSTRRIEAIGEAIVTRVVELLHAPVFVIDAQGIVIASSNRHLVGLPVDPPTRELQQSALRVPLLLHSHSLQVAIGESHTGEVISPRLARAFIELAIDQLDLAERSPQEKADYKDGFIYDLLHGLVHDEAVILREARMLGLNITLRRAVLLVDARDYILMPSDDTHSPVNDNEVRNRAKTVIQSIVDCLLLPDDTICAYIGDGEIAVLKASNTKNLELWANGGDGSETASASWTNLHALKRAGTALLERLQRDTGTPISIGLGRYHPGIQGLARSYQDARVALSLGRRFQGQNHVHCLDELGIAAFIGVPDERTKIELATHLLSPLHHFPELHETLAVFFAQNCFPSATANQLSIHRNTLSHRLDKITALTGLDPRQFDDAIQIRLALLLHDL